jgi:hypothetical protein
LFIKPYGRIALFAIKLCPYKGFIKVGQTLLGYWPRRLKPMVGQESLYNADPSFNDAKYLDT